MKEEKAGLGLTLALAYPIIIENILQTFLGTADTYFAGQISDRAIAGIGVTNVVMNLFISFFSAVSIGTAAIIARNYGRKDFAQARLAIVQSVLLGLGLGLGLGLSAFLLAGPILRLTGASSSVIDVALPYYSWVALPSVFLCLQLILSSCLRAIKDTRMPMYATGISNLINILLNAVFLRLGLGIMGLALATTLSRVLGMLLLFHRLHWHDNQIHFSKDDFRLNRQLLQSIVRIGLPAGLEKLVMRIGQLLYNGMIISIGLHAYIAHNIGGSIEGYSYIPAMGFGMAVATLVGTALGENDAQKAVRQTRNGYFLAALSTAVIGLVFYIYALPLASLFTPTREIQLLVAHVLRIIALFQPFLALVQVLGSALQGAGDTKFPMYTTFIGIWGIRLGVGYLLALPLGLGLEGVWYAYGLDLVVRGLLLLWRFLQGKWKTIAI